MAPNIRQIAETVSPPHVRRRESSRNDAFATTLCSRAWRNRWTSGAKPRPPRAYRCSGPTSGARAPRPILADPSLPLELTPRSLRRGASTSRNLPRDPDQYRTGKREGQDASRVHEHALTSAHIGLAGRRAGATRRCTVKPLNTVGPKARLVIRTSTRADPESGEYALVEPCRTGTPTLFRGCSSGVPGVPVRTRYLNFPGDRRLLY